MPHTFAQEQLSSNGKCDICEKCGCLAYRLIGHNKHVCEDCRAGLNDNPNPKTITMKLNALANRLFDKDTKALIKAGLMQTDGDLTAEGRAELDAIVFLANKEALVKRAEERIEEMKDEK
jgi:hypothetical protein